MAFHERVQPGETEQFEAFAVELREIQQRRAEKSGKLERTLHVKAHTCLVGELAITAKEPQRVGVFSGDPASFPVYATPISRSTRGTPSRRTARSGRSCARAAAYRESVLGRKAAPEPESVISLDGTASRAAE